MREIGTRQCSAISTSQGSSTPGSLHAGPVMSRDTSLVHHWQLTTGLVTQTHKRPATPKPRPSKEWRTSQPKWSEGSSMSNQFPCRSLGQKTIIQKTHKLTALMRNTTCKPIKITWARLPEHRASVAHATAYRRGGPQRRHFRRATPRSVPLAQRMLNCSSTPGQAQRLVDNSHYCSSAFVGCSFET